MNHNSQGSAVLGLIIIAILIGIALGGSTYMGL
jgi:hypothetical protein